MSEKSTAFRFVLYGRVPGPVGFGPTGPPKNLGVDNFPDPVGHFEAPWWPFWSFEVLMEGMMELKNLFNES